MQIKTSIFIVVLIFYFKPYTSFSQQLVPNSSFEEAYSCPVDYTRDPVKELIPNWTNPNKGTPDYLHKCSELAGVPINFAGESEAYDGDGYIGLILRQIDIDSTSRKNAAREYVEVELSSPLEFRQLYCFNLKYKHSSKSMYSVDMLGASFTREKLKAFKFGMLDAEPMVYNIPGKVMSNKDEWVELCGVFRARGREKYLTIGNFAPIPNTYFFINNDTCKDADFNLAYYYIDDVKLYKIDNDFECGCLNTNSTGYDWLDDNSKSFLDSYYETLYDMESKGYLNPNMSVKDEFFNDNLLAETNDAKNKFELNENSENNKLFTDSTNNQTQYSNQIVENINNNKTIRGNEWGKNLDINTDDFLHSERLENIEDNKTRNSISESNEKLKNSLQDGSKGLSIELTRIYFAYDQSELLPSSYPTLETIVISMKNNPKLKIEIQGHTDNVGNSRYNKKLSTRRAKSVHDFLTDSGISEQRLKYIGFGNTRPLYDNSTEIGRSKNRRVEIKIL